MYFAEVFVWESFFAGWNDSRIFTINKRNKIRVENPIKSCTNHCSIVKFKTCIERQKSSSQNQIEFLTCHSSLSFFIYLWDVYHDCWTTENKSSSCNQVLFKSHRYLIYRTHFQRGSSLKNLTAFGLIQRIDHSQKM